LTLCRLLGVSLPLSYNWQHTKITFGLSFGTQGRCSDRKYFHTTSKLVRNWWRGSYTFYTV